MNKPTRRLGRGLDSLIPQSFRHTDQDNAIPLGPLPFVQPSQIGGSSADSSITRDIPIASIIQNEFQPRLTISTEELERLAASIKENGLLQPVVVRALGNSFQLIAGQRRWLAAKQVGMTHIPAIIRDATDDQMLEWALIENIQREDLNAIDRAQAYRQYCTKFNATSEQLAERLAEDRTTVANYIRLLELPADIQRLVGSGELSMGHARCLLGIPQDETRRSLARSAIEFHWSVRALEQQVRNAKAEPAPKGPKKAGDPVHETHLRDMEQRFEQALKTRVSIKTSRRKGSGQILIDFFSIDDFDRIAQRLGVELE